MKRLTSKYLSAQLFVFLCLFAFASLILCYVVFGDHREAIEMEELKRINRSLMHEYYETHKHNLKNILMWTHNFTEPFVFFRMGREHFINAGCQYNNCNITNDKSYFDDVTEWDALLFHAPEYTRKGNSWNHPSPKARKSDQVYTLVSIESSGNYPICEERWDDYFNWTMTYMLDSDVPWEYFVIRDRKTNKIVGPARDMKWADNMAGVSEEVKNGLKNKTKAVAWFVSNCRTISKREDYVKELEVEMKKLGLVLDIYGKCGKLSCEEAACYEKLRDDYMFYLSFENSFSTDYVTEKLLTAMQNDVVPIVWGGGNYSRFAPPDSYIDARKHSPQELAALIQELTKDIELYSKFFNWRQYYSYHGVMESYESHPLCRLCKALNEPSNPRVKKNIASWWNGDNSC